MAQALAAKVVKRTKDSIQIKIAKENFEAFCDAIGLYRKEFLEALDASEQDHRAGRVTKRKSLTTSEAAPSISPARQRKILAENARRLYRLR